MHACKHLHMLILLHIASSHTSTYTGSETPSSSKHITEFLPLFYEDYAKIEISSITFYHHCTVAAGRRTCGAFIGSRMRSYWARSMRGIAIWKVCCSVPGRSPRCPHRSSCKQCDDLGWEIAWFLPNRREPKCSTGYKTIHLSTWAKSSTQGHVP